MTYAGVGFDLTWPGGFGVDVFTGTPGPALLIDWGPSIVPGSPGSPTGVGLMSFGTSFGAAPQVPAPSGAPDFLGYFFESILPSQLGVVFCSGPAAVANPAHGGQYEVDPQGLTVLQTWFVGPSFKDTVASWLPLTAGVYYYVAFEVYTGSASSGRIAISVEADVCDGAIGTEYNGNSETVVPVGATVSLTGVISRAAGPVDLDLDWGDGATATQHYDHSGLGTQADDWFLNNQIVDLAAALTHVYTAVGSYVVRGTFTDAAGGVSVTKLKVFAVGPPTCSLDVEPTTVHLPGSVAIVASGHSDAWDMRAELADAYGYDVARRGISCFFAPPHTGWELLSSGYSSGDAFGSDHVTDAFWEGAGIPVNDPVPASPLPTEVWYPASADNLNDRSRGFAAEITLRINDCFNTWSQEATVDVEVSLGTVYQRSFPRDDGNGLSTMRSFPPPVDSVRSYPHIP